MLLHVICLHFWLYIFVYSDIKFPKCSLTPVQFISVAPPPPPTHITRLSLGSTEAPFNGWLMFVWGPIPGEQEMNTIHC